MLILKRHVDEIVVIDCDGTLIEVMVTEISPGYIRLGFEAPRHVKILREELWEPAMPDKEK